MAKRITLAVKLTTSRTIVTAAWRQAQRARLNAFFVDRENIIHRLKTDKDLVGGEVMDDHWRRRGFYLYMLKSVDKQIATLQIICRSH